MLHQIRSEDFADILLDSMDSHKISKLDASNLFKVPLPTIVRWLNGETCPSEAIQTEILKHLERSASLEV